MNNIYQVLTEILIRSVILNLSQINFRLFL